MTVVAIVEVLSRCEAAGSYRPSRSQQQRVEKLHEDCGGIVHRVCQPSIALQHSSIGDAQAPAKRMVTCEIGVWTFLDPAFCAWIETIV
jgi:hypothetical protein